MSYIQIGPKIDGKQSITLAKDGYVPVTYVSTPKEIDKFTAEANAAKDKQSKRNNINLGVGIGGSALLGTLLSKKLSLNHLEGAGFGAVLGMSFSLLLCMYQQSKMYDNAIDNFIKNNPQ